MQSGNEGVGGGITEGEMENVAQLLLAIETHAIHLLVITRNRLRALLTGQQTEEIEYDFEVSKALLERSDSQLTIHDLERSVSTWGPLLPDDPQIKARLVHRLGGKYAFAQGDAPDLQRALGLDSEEVTQAYLKEYGQPLETVYANRSPADNRPFWFKIPEFLHPDVMKDLQSELEWVNLPWGETLFEMGDMSDGIYIVVTGRLRIEKEGVILEEVGRGDVIGEITVLTGENRRMAGAYAIRDSELIRLRGDGFERLFMSHPGVAFQFTKQVISQMRLRLTRERKATQVGTIAVLPVHDCTKIAGFLEKLVEALNAHGKTMLLNSKIIRSKLGEGADTLDENDPRAKELLIWLNAQELAHRFLILEADPTDTQWTKRCLRTADRIFLVAEASSAPTLDDLERDLYTSEFLKISPARDLVLLYDHEDQRPGGTIEWLDNRQVDHHYHITLDAPQDFARLARFLAGKAVSLVFSGGGARGLVHVGVFKAVEEIGIPWDAVGGASFGGIVAACIGAGWDARLLDRNMHEFAGATGQHFRVTLPVVSLMDGRRMNRVFQSYFGDANIEDLWRDTLIVSSNLTRSRLKVHRTGPLWRAARASMSIPAVFPPFLEHGELLVDGGVLNNMPTDVMKEHTSGGFVIASDCRSKKDIAPYQYDNSFSPWGLVFGRINPFRERSKAPNLVEITALTIGAGEKQRESAQLANTDLPINIDADDFEIFDYDHIDDLIHLGYETAMRAFESQDSLPL